MAAVVVACNLSLVTVHLFLVRAVFNADLNEKFYLGMVILGWLFMTDGENRHDICD